MIEIEIVSVLIAFVLWYVCGAFYLIYHSWKDRNKPKVLLNYIFEVMPWYQRYPLYLAVIVVGPLFWFQIEMDRQVNC